MRIFQIVTTKESIETDQWSMIIDNRLVTTRNVTDQTTWLQAQLILLWIRLFCMDKKVKTGLRYTLTTRLVSLS